MKKEINKIIRVYDEERSGDEIFFDIYELVLSKLDSELLVKDT
jgi:hypothetical protein